MMVKGLVAVVGLSLMLVGCAEVTAKNESLLKDEPAEPTPEELMYEQQQRMQQQMMQQGRPLRIGPGRR